MVLELLFNPFSVKKKPWQMFLAGFLYSIIGLGLSFFVFREIAGILMVFLITISTLPLVYTTIKNEEELDMRYDQEWKLLKEHTKVLIFLMFMFFGITSALVVSYVFLPSNVVDSVFSLQEEAILSVNNDVQGKFLGSLTRFTIFSRIFLNNMKVLFFCLVFSLLYGTGAVFILTWNASVIATAMGNLIKSEIAQSANAAGLATIATYFGAASFSFLRYMTHGFLEVIAYFTAGLAGGIISIAIIKHNLKEDKVLIDALDLILISVGLILIAGLVEVYITPVLFA
jgi:uncharacterized membrane protein SpoIIM required for sporulation